MPQIYLNNPNTSFGIIYTYTNLISGKVYVGQTIHPNRRKSRYHTELDAKRAINRAMKKYGINNFVYAVIDHASDEAALNFLERHYIQQFKSHTTQHGYNMTLGGDGMSGFRHRDDSKRKMSLTKQGVTLSPSLKEYFNWKGRKRGPQAEDHKRKIVQSRIGVPLSAKHKAKLSEIVTCPHCNTQGGKTAMYRWHFDKCARYE